MAYTDDGFLRSSAPAAEAPKAEAPKQDITLTYMASVDWVQNAEIEGLAPKFTEETGIKIAADGLSLSSPQVVLTRLQAKNISKKNQTANGFI